MKRFAIIGVASYIAPRHLKAIKDTNNTLIASMDKSDSVGILDSYFPKSSFFTDFEKFDDFIVNQEKNNKKIDYLSICTPNYLHNEHIEFALDNNMNAICEKPTVLNPYEIEKLINKEINSKNKVYTILQLRIHPEIVRLKNKINNSENKKLYQVELNYHVPRGNWYFNSWKGDIKKSGGICFNIGIHLFDVLIYLFGNVESFKIMQKSEKTVSGMLNLRLANVKWSLSIDMNGLNCIKSIRELKVNDEIFDFSNGFEDLHTISYQKILAKEGFLLDDIFPSIDLAYSIKTELGV